MITVIRALIVLALAIRLNAEVPPLPAPSQTAAPIAPAPAQIQEQVLRPPEPGRFKQLFQPFRTNAAAISPDGKHLAYSIREGEILSVVVLEIEHPETIKTHVQVIDDSAATPMLAINQREKTPGRINWMRWVTPTRLVLETNRVYAHTTAADMAWQSWRGDVIAFDVDGSHPKLLASPLDLEEFVEDNKSAQSFSVQRGNSNGFNTRTWSADRPVNPPVEDSTNTLPPQNEAVTPDLLAAEVEGAAPREKPGSYAPRSLRVFDLDPSKPDAIKIVVTGLPRIGGSHSVSLYSLNIQNGKMKDLTDDLVANTDVALLDRQGIPRVTVPNSLLSKFPFRYDYLGAKGRNHAKSLDESTGLTGFSVSPENYFGARAIPLGFDEKPGLLYYASNTGRDTYGIYSLDLATKQRGHLAMENPAYDLIGPPAAGFPDQSSLVFDRYTHELIGVRYDSALRTTAWIRPDLQAMQAEFERTFPGRSVEISDWDEAGKHFIVSTEGPADPGAFFIFDREKNKLLEFVRRAPWVEANHTHRTLPFSYATKDNAHISGLVTVPHNPRLKPIPMVILCPDLPWQRVKTNFQTEVQALADMGFVVVQLNGRGAWGLGLHQRQSLTTGYDLVQIEDIASAVGTLEQIFNVNAKRVALMGRGHGGFIALRALQTYPEKFRCAIALDAPVNLGNWLEEQKWSDDSIQPHLTRAWLGDATRLKAAPLTSHPETLTKPVLMLNYPGLEGAIRRTSYVAARHFASQVKDHGTTIEFGDLRTDYVHGLPAARAEVFDKIEGFLNTNVYDFNVKLQEMKILK